jgi:hypothetical protein
MYAFGDAGRQQARATVHPRRGLLACEDRIARNRRAGFVVGVSR